jgi:hypothetical protein
MSFMGLVSYISDVKDLYLETSLNYAAFMVAILAQEADPWNINYTIVPILSWTAIFIGIKIV